MSAATKKIYIGDDDVPPPRKKMQLFENETSTTSAHAEKPKIFIGDDDVEQATSKPPRMLLFEDDTMPTEQSNMFIDNDDDDDDDSASDSLVRIHEEQRALLARQTARTSTGPSDQVARLIGAHEDATSAAQQAADDDASETTIDQAATAARVSAMPAVALASIGATMPAAQEQRALSLPPPLTVGHVRDVFAGSTTGKMPPLEMRDNYELLGRQMDASLHANHTGVSGKAGLRVAEISSKLVREAPKQLNAMTLPRVLASISSPLERCFMQRLVTDTIEEASLPPHLNDPQNTAVTRMRQALRVSRRAHEEKMLRPPRPNEPACSNGADCQGNALICQSGGMTLVAFYYEDEWAKYAYDREHAIPETRLPDNARVCLLCLRYDMQRFVMSTRTQNVQFLIENSATAPNAMPALVQPHFNLTEVEGEYCLADCITPVTPVFEGILYPMVKSSLTQFIRIIDPETGGPMLRQLFPYPGAGSVTTTSIEPSPPSF
jgi:hypothetical protein